MVEDITGGNLECEHSLVDAVGQLRDSDGQVGHVKARVKPRAGQVFPVDVVRIVIGGLAIVDGIGIAWPDGRVAKCHATHPWRRIVAASQGVGSPRCWYQVNFVFELGQALRLSPLHGCPLSDWFVVVTGTYGKHKHSKQ